MTLKRRCCERMRYSDSFVNWINAREAEKKNFQHSPRSSVVPQMCALLHY